MLAAATGRLATLSRWIRTTGEFAAARRGNGEFEAEEVRGRYIDTDGFTHSTDL